jgi:hypothetical protein
MNEPLAVIAYLFTHYPYTPYRWTLEEVNKARKASGLRAYGEEDDNVDIPSS